MLERCQATNSVQAHSRVFERSLGIHNENLEAERKRIIVEIEWLSSESSWTHLGIFLSLVVLIVFGILLVYMSYRKMSQKEKRIVIT